MTRPPRALSTLTLMLMTSLWGAVWPAQAPPLKNGFDLAGSLVPPGEIHQGGPPRDGIPALDDPRFVDAGEAGFFDGSARAFDDEGRPLAGINGFWFAWYAFHPDTEVFKARKAAR